ncbi:MAG: CRISPR-associated protein Cmr6 [Thermococcaceae archaeon]|nr:CRISPR-associated protein Cmr6 [Thermococcaceae archaeon]MDK2914958.1 CRISPR-associated protein Cmr6 [Thermococcaceae archaeon]
MYGRKNYLGRPPDRNRREPTPRKNNQGGQNRDRGRIEYIVPGETLTILHDPLGKIDNLSLKLEKYSPFELDKNGSKKPSLKALQRTHGALQLTDKARGLYEKFFEKHKEMIRSLGTKWSDMENTSRLVVGLGDESVYEVSIRLMRNYGIPYIPGTALKGVTKAYTIEMLAELLAEHSGICNDFFECAGKVQEWLNGGAVDNFPEKVRAENVSKQLKEFLGIFLGEPIPEEIPARKIAETAIMMFGTTEKEGSVVFFDALPYPESLNGEVLEFDIMNPHYGSYYQEGKPPGDWYNPVPVFFLTVRKGVKFHFAVGRSKTCKDQELVNKAEKLLKLALKEHGVGAKTSLGYGRFKEVP